MIKQIAYADRDEWLKLRKGYIGGSDAAAVMGLNPYVSPYSLWAEKTGRTEGFEGNLTTEVGAYLEEFVAKLFERETGKKVRKQNKMLVNDDYPWACADVDRVVIGEDAILEIKTTTSLGNMRMLRNGEYPTQYYCQMTHYLAVTGKQKAYLAVLINNREFKWFELERDEDELSALMAEEQRFMEMVKTDTPPQAIGIDADDSTLQTIYPEGDGSSVDLMGYRGLLDEYDTLSSQIKQLDEQRKAICQQIQQFMGAAEFGRAEGYKVKWSNATRRSLDTKAVTQAMPGILDGFYKETPYRVFKIIKEV